MTSFKVRVLPFSIDQMMAILRPEEAAKIGVDEGERVRVTYGERSSLALVSTSTDGIQPNTVLLSKKVAGGLGVTDGVDVDVVYSPPPLSVQAIRSAIQGKSLSKEMSYAIVNDVVTGTLSEAELSAFIVSQVYRTVSMDEVEYLARAMADSGQKLDFGRTVYDKHSIGGVPGNKVSLLIVPIVAAAGLLIPKTSSRSITSPSGTADTMEVLAPVDLDPAEFKRVALKVGGAIVWGGRLGLAPADDIFIKKVEHPLSIDPVSQLLASVMSKKLAVSANYLVVDLPVGVGTKLETEDMVRDLAARFIELGRRLGIYVTCGMTYGSQPVGHAVGSALEAREALEALSGKGPTSLIEKSTSLAGLLLEASGFAGRGLGKEMAMRILETGKALKKMREIIEAQGGNPNVKPDDIAVGTQRAKIESPADGYVVEVSNSAINAIAKAAGSPVDKGAGVLLHAKVGYSVKKGDPLLEIFSEHPTKLSESLDLAQRLKPMTVEGMLLGRLPEVL